MSLNDSDAIIAELKTLRRWRRATLLLLAISPVVVLILYYLPWPNASEILAFCWVAVIAVPLARTVHSPCPRCGYQFFSTLVWTQPWARACIHCGQEL